ncbi:hypothetical protein DL96DRAFT_1469427, partial [Flagelloscypha sp. PMI_526]
VYFKNVTEFFKAAWRHPQSACPTMEHVYKVVNSEQTITRYNEYQASVESRGQFRRAGRQAGKESRRFHGTRRQCLLVDPGSIEFCSSPACALCYLLKTSFDISTLTAAAGPPRTRFGRGIYCTSTSSKAFDYSFSQAGSPFRFIILASVIIGRGYKSIQGDPSLIAPPAVFDSVLDEVGGSLNYDETVRYSSDGILPVYLILYR